MADSTVSASAASNAVPRASPESAPPSSKWNFSYAAAPDIIRANQKDAYFQGVLAQQIADVFRNFYGARVLHKYMLETKTAAELLYYALTTLRGSRTLGEEYCDIVHVEANTLQLPLLDKRLGYILTSVFAPYFLAKALPSFRQKLKTKLDRQLARDRMTGKANTLRSKIQAYLRKNIDAITASENILGVHLAIFYFSGAYYQLAKRLWGLRYIFTKRLGPHEQRAGYEVLGVLMLSQLLVQSYNHLRTTFGSPADAQNAAASDSASTIQSVVPEAIVEEEDERTLEDETFLPFITGVSRKCTLCLEFMKTPTSTSCGHMFCWSCVEEWCRSKPECPLCRQTVLVQHLLPIRG